MIRWQSEIVLNLLWILPFLLLLFYAFMRRRKRLLENAGDSSLIQQLFEGYSAKRLWVKFSLLLTALALIIIGIANPQIGSKLEQVKREGVDVIIALDVSNSMLAEDLQPNRLDRSKVLVSKLLDQLHNDRVGLIVFAGQSYLQMPLTIDYSAAKLFLNTITPNSIPTQGTSLGSAIELAQESFDQDEDKFKALVIITDGENHEQGAIDAAETAMAEGMVIYTVGVGSEEGAQIPYYQGRHKSYRTDKNQQVVISKLNESILKELASITNGKYFRIKGTKNEVVQVVRELSKMEKKEFEGRVFTDYEDQFQYFIGIAIILLLLQLFIRNRVKA